MTAPWEQTTQEAGHAGTADTLRTDSSNISSALPAAEQQEDNSNISRCTLAQAKLRCGQTMARGPNEAVIQPVKREVMIVFGFFNVIWKFYSESF